MKLRGFCHLRNPAKERSFDASWYSLGLFPAQNFLMD